MAALAGATGLLLALTPGLDAPSAAADAAAPAEIESSPLGDDEAAAKAVRTGEEVEADALATPTTRVVALPEGGFRAEVSALPSRVQDAHGEWQSVDNTLIRTADGQITPKRPAAPMSFSAGGDDALARIADEDRSLAVSWPGGELPEPDLVGSAAHYRDVLPGVDLVAQAGPTGFSTFVVVESREAALNPAVRDLALDVHADGVNVADTTMGGLEAKDGTETVFTAAQPLMWDSEGVTDRVVEEAFTPEEKAVDAPLTPPLAAEPVEMPMQASNTEISLAVPEQVLDDPKTVYPVVLDPGITTAGIEYGGWTMLWSNGTTMYNHPTEMARVGYDGWSGSPKKSRSFFHMDVPLNALQGTYITSATFTHRQIHSPQNTCGVNYGPAIQIHRTERFTASHTWSNQPAVLSSQSENAFGHGNEAYCPGFDRQSFNVLSGVKDAVAEGKDLTLRMKSADETDRNGWRKYDNTQLGYPELSIAYYAKPPVPGNLSVTPSGTTTAGDMWTSSLAPELSATVRNHTTNGASPVYGKFQLVNGAGTEVWRGMSQPVAATGGTARAQVPAGRLTGGQTYRLRVWASADANGNYVSDQLPEVSLRVDSTVPAAVQASLSPAGNSLAENIFPVLTAPLVGPADVALTGKFEIVDGVTGEVLDEGDSESVVAGQSAEFPVSEDSVLSGHPYRWRVAATDGSRTSSFSDYQTFHTWAEIPLEDMALIAGEQSLPCTDGAGMAVVPPGEVRVKAAIYDLDTVPGAEPASFEAEVWAVNGEVPLATGVSGSFAEGADATWTIPDTVDLILGHSYKVRVRDSRVPEAEAPWSNFCGFTVNDGPVTPPTQEQFLTTLDPEAEPQVAEPVLLIEEDQTLGTMATCPTPEGEEEIGCLAQVEVEIDPATADTSLGPYVEEPEEMGISSNEPLHWNNRAKWPSSCGVMRPRDSRYWEGVDRRHACLRRPVTSVYQVGRSSATATGFVDTTMTISGTHIDIHTEMRFTRWTGGTYSPALPRDLRLRLNCGLVCENGSGTAIPMRRITPNGSWWEHNIRMTWDVMERGKEYMPSSIDYIGVLAPGGPQEAKYMGPSSLRCDDLFNSRNKRRARLAGCVFDHVPGIWAINRTSYGYASRHIADAHAARLPGRPGHGALTRIKKSTNAQQAAAQRKNRNAVCGGTDPYRPEPLAGVAWQCDEYPMASTYQGGQKPTRTEDWCQMEGTGVYPTTPNALTSRCWIPGTHNGSAGAAWLAWANNERLIDKDRFYIVFG